MSKSDLLPKRLRLTPGRLCFMIVIMGILALIFAIWAFIANLFWLFILPFICLSIMTLCLLRLEPPLREGEQYEQLLQKIAGFNKPNEMLTKSQFDEWCQRRNLSEYSSGSDSLQFDGLYRADAGKYDAYLRFYPDGAALSVIVIKPSTVEEIARWLGRDNGTVSHGKYERLGTQIALTEHDSNWASYFRGVVINDHMIYLESYSHDIEYHWYYYQKPAKLV